MKQIYTLEIHIERLIRMFQLSEEQNKPLKLFCPASDKFSTPVFLDKMSEKWSYSKGNYPCFICKTFVGIHQHEYNLCPCQILKNEAKERTVIAVESYMKGITNPFKGGK